MELRRIIFIDDNPAIHEDYRKILCGAPVDTSEFTDDDEFLFGKSKASQPPPMFEADSAFQGEDGLHLVRAACEEHRPYQVALVDIRMPPGWDGVETAKQIWDVDPNVLVVFCTAYSDYSWAEMTNSLGRHDQFVILKKPFDNLELLQLVTALSRKWELERKSDFGFEQLNRTLEQQTEHHRREMSDFVDRVRIACVDMAYRQSRHELHTAETATLSEIADEFVRKSQQPGESDCSVTSGSFLGEVSSRIDHALKEMIPSLDAAGCKSENIDKAKLSASSLLSVVRNLHCLSLLDTNRFHLKQETFPISNAISAIKDSSKPLAEANGLAFSCRCEIDPDTAITGDEGRILHVLFNVLDNAFQYTDEGKVELSVEALGEDWLSFEISDTGRGISETQAKSLFKLFNSEVASGLPTDDFCLGLLVCKRIIDHTGGQIEFDSRENCGSTFRIALPTTCKGGRNLNSSRGNATQSEKQAT